MDKICDLCGKFETGRFIKSKAVCAKCFIEGQYNLPENQAKLAEAPPVEIHEEPAQPKIKRAMRR